MASKKIKVLLFVVYAMIISFLAFLAKITYSFNTDCSKKDFTYANDLISVVITLIIMIILTFIPILKNLNIYFNVIKSINDNKKSVTINDKQEAFKNVSNITKYIFYIIPLGFLGLEVSLIIFI